MKEPDAAVQEAVEVNAPAKVHSVLSHRSSGRLLLGPIQEDEADFVCAPESGRQGCRGHSAAAAHVRPHTIDKSPAAFLEHADRMLSTALQSPAAAQVRVARMRCVRLSPPTCSVRFSVHRLALGGEAQERGDGIPVQ